MSDNLEFWSAAHLASLLVSQDFGKVLMTAEEASCSRTALLRLIISRAGLFGKTYPEFCHQTADGILEPSLRYWRSAGMGSPTEFLMLGTSACPNGAEESTLSAVLETGDVPQRYYLTASACKGILRRAKRRGKKLPEKLKKALEMQCI